MGVFYTKRENLKRSRYEGRDFFVGWELIDAAFAIVDSTSSNSI